MPLFLIILLILSSVTSANAARSDLANETQLRGVITRLLEAQKTAFEKGGGSMITQGGVVVEPANNYFAVTLPDITLMHPNKSQTALGLIALNASPAGPESWNITVAMPTPIATVSENGKLESELSLGQQHFTGIWNETLSGFTTLKSLYSDSTLSLYNTDKRLPFTSLQVAKAGYGFALKNTSKDQTDVALRFTLENMSTTGTNTAYTKILPKNITANLDAQKFPLHKLAELQRELGNPDKIFNIFKNTGAEIIINEISVNNDNAGMVLTGHLKPAPKAPLGYTGTAVLDVERIEQILLGLNEVATKIPPSDQGKIQGMRIALTLMAALGENINSNGKMLKRYNVELKENGQILMNGTDFSTLIGGVKTAKKIATH